MSPKTKEPGERIAFESFELELTTGELFKSGRRIRLAKQPSDLLVLLARRRGALVTREELRSALWPEDTFVDFDHGLNNCIRRIREALGDTADSSRFVETLPKKGYRFISESRTLTSLQDSHASVQEPTAHESAAPTGPGLPESRSERAAPHTGQTPVITDEDEGGPGQNVADPARSVLPRFLSRRLNLLVLSGSILFTHPLCGWLVGGVELPRLARPNTRDAC